MSELCYVCGREVVSRIPVLADGKLFNVCSFECKDAVVGNRNVDVGCGVVDGDKVRSVNMCGECALESMPFTCYTAKRDQKKSLMFVVYGRRNDDE